jgi:hypothetical protein
VLREFRCENLIWTIPQLLQKLGVFVAQTQGSAPLHPGLSCLAPSALKIRNSVWDTQIFGAWDVRQTTKPCALTKDPKFLAQVKGQQVFMSAGEAYPALMRPILSPL